MGEIVWLASYPKSGNTWVRVLLTNYLRDGEVPADVNELESTPIASARVWFDEWAGLEASALSDETIERLRPGVYRCLARAAAERLYMKVHDAWMRTADGEPLFPAEVTGGVIYIIRNPLDLVASVANHCGLTLRRSADLLCNPDATLAPSHGGLSDQLRQYTGDWSHHVTSWVDRSDLRLHLVRYEDLRADPLGAFAAIVRFCGLKLDEATAAKAVAFSDFRELQQQEQRGGFRERLPSANGLFFRQGQAGAWRRELPAELVARVIETQGPTMRRFGYLDDEGPV